MGPSKCRSCGAPILWVKSAEGKTMPLDADPVPDGTLVLVDGTAFTAFTAVTPS